MAVLACLLAFVLATSFVANCAVISPIGPDASNTPDGRFSVIAGNATYVKFQTPDVRYLGTSNLPEEGTIQPVTVFDNGTNFVATSVFANSLPSNEVTGLRSTDTWDTFNLWTMSIFRLAETSQPDADSDELIGFSHCEDHDNASVWKSVHVVISTDLGITWTRPVPILTAQARQPETGAPTYNGGLGDMAVVWDSTRQRWVCFFQEVGVSSLAMAVSYDPRGASTTWTKIDPTSKSSSPGLMGLGYPHPDLAAISGSGPTLLFSTLADAWLMVYHFWGGSLAWSASGDLDGWSTPQYLPVQANNNITYNYPIMVGSVSDVLTEQENNNLYYAQFDGGVRSMLAQMIQWSDTTQTPVLA